MDLDELRKEIDKTDKEIVDAFVRRMKISGEIAEYKKLHEIPVFDSEREKQKLDEVRQLSEDEFSGYVKNLYAGIFKLSRDYQQSLMDGEGESK